MGTWEPIPHTASLAKVTIKTWWRGDWGWCSVCTDLAWYKEDSEFHPQYHIDGAWGCVTVTTTFAK